MKAMIFAAGLGTRLRPLTNNRPKALVEVNGVPLLEIVIRRLIQAGVTELVINVHHFAEQVIAFLEKKQFFGVPIHISYETEKLLDTGGGLKKAAVFFKDKQPFLLHNTDIVSNIDLRKMYAFHCQSKAIATMATRQRNTSRYLLFSESDQLLWGWTNTKTQEYKWSRRQSTVFERRAFSGIHVIDPAFFKYFPEDDIFSIIDTYLQAAQTETILSYPHDEDIWLDAGKPEYIQKAVELLPYLKKIDK